MQDIRTIRSVAPMALWATELHTENSPSPTHAWGELALAWSWWAEMHRTHARAQLVSMWCTGAKRLGALVRLVRRLLCAVPVSRVCQCWERVFCSDCAKCFRHTYPFSIWAKFAPARRNFRPLPQNGLRRPLPAFLQVGNIFAVLAQHAEFPASDAITYSGQIATATSPLVALTPACRHMGLHHRAVKRLAQPPRILLCIADCGHLTLHTTTSYAPHLLFFEISSVGPMVTASPS